MMLPLTDKNEPVLLIGVGIPRGEIKFDGLPDGNILMADTVKEAKAKAQECAPNCVIASIQAPKNEGVSLADPIGTLECGLFNASPVAIYVKKESWIEAVLLMPEDCAQMLRDMPLGRPAAEFMRIASYGQRVFISTENGLPGAVAEIYQKLSSRMAKTNGGQNQIFYDYRKTDYAITVGAGMVVADKKSRMRLQ